MRELVLIAAMAALSACAGHAAPANSAIVNAAPVNAAPTPALAHGRTLVATYCSRCHAIDRTGASPFSEAPPFRTLSHKYPVDSIAEALSEGISVGHPAMPEFQFSPNDVEDVVGYLQSIQDQPARP